MNNKTNVKDFLLNYSFKDLARSFFVLNLWLPNRASPIKIQWLYVLLESIFDKLPKEDRIKIYEDFKEFSEALLPKIPSFPALEDYVPEGDWGEIKYFFHDKFFKIFYGSELSNTYEYYYLFEVIHAGFAEFYFQKTERSAMKEYEFCLAIQDLIISGIDKATQETYDVSPGNITTPIEVFWRSSMGFLDKFDPLETYPTELVAQYKKDLDEEVPASIPSQEEFLSRAFEGKNCFYFFLKKDGNIFPVLPRKYIAVLFDTWGKILNENRSLIEKEVKSPHNIIGNELCDFVRQRINEKNFFCFVSAIQGDLKPHRMVFPIAFRSRNKLVLLYVVPLPSAGNDQENIWEGLASEYREAQELFLTSPTRLYLRGQGKYVEFQSQELDVRTLEPFFLTVFLNTTTENSMVRPPENLPGEIIGLIDLLGILDEEEDLNELAEFFDYVERTRSSIFLSPMSSYLDMFGSYKDSSGILVPGASQPSFVMLDPHWGSSFRYRSLFQFWTMFPEHNFFGHPRSWSIGKNSLCSEYLVLKSKTFWGYAYHCSVGEASVFVNSPVDSLSLEQVKLADLMMHSLVDGIKVYQDLLQELPLAKKKAKLHFLFFPLSLINGNMKFIHLRHLIPQAGIWVMDTFKFQMEDYGIRVVFDDQKLVTSLHNAKDRTIQIELLLGVLEEIISIFGDSGFSKVKQRLEAEKKQKIRFGVFAIEKRVSFPEMAPHTIPQTREYKLADNVIAVIARESNVLPGEYAKREAKDKIEQLKNGLIQKINQRVKELNIKDAIPVLISNIDALTNEHVWKHAQVIHSIYQEVEYEREVFAGQDEGYFLQHHTNYRYLIEKFVQLQPNGSCPFTAKELGELLGLVNRLLLFYSCSDLLHYGMYPARVTISSDFLTSIVYGADIPGMQKEAAEEKAKIDLGMIGNKNDRISLPFEMEPYIEALDKAFKKDLGFFWMDMVNLQRILSLWAAHHIDPKENTYYKATLNEISEACTRGIDNFDSSTTEKILEFLTLDQENVLVIEGDERPASDLPVWEYRKRRSRYGIRPLVKIGELYYWGPHSAERSARMWGSIPDIHSLPADISSPSVEATLRKGHEAIEKALQEKIKDIVGRFTSKVKSEVRPYKLGFWDEDVGDIDVFAWLEKKNILLNIEAKVIDQAFCNKDLKRISKKIFGRVKTTDGSFEAGYLQMVEKRAAVLDQRGREVAGKYWGNLSTLPHVVSIFVTQSGYWWTKYPPRETKVHFIELQLLEDFLKNLLP